MGWFGDQAEVEVLIVSGVLRVTVRPRPKLSFLLTTAAIIVAFALMSGSEWRQTPLLGRMAEAVTVLGAVFVWLQRLSGSEEQIEIGERGIRITREILGWHRTSEFPIEQCSDLDLQTGKDLRRLQCRVGHWRTIEFGNYMSKEQAERVLDTLADSLPELGRKLLPSVDITQHWTTLNQ
jgi:hypothetical protein